MYMLFNHDTGIVFKICGNCQACCFSTLCLNLQLWVYILGELICFTIVSIGTWIWASDSTQKKGHEKYCWESESDEDLPVSDLDLGYPLIYVSIFYLEHAW